MRYTREKHVQKQERVKMSYWSAPGLLNSGHNIITKVVCNYYGISESHIYQKIRKKEIVWPRQVSMYMHNHFLEYTSAKIGLYCGNKDHATVLHSIKLVTNLCEVDKEVRQQIIEIEKRIIKEKVFFANNKEKAPF